MTTWLRWRRPVDDQGTIGILTLGFAVVALILVLVVSAATAVHLSLLRLTHLADELAQDAADAVDRGSYYGGGPDGGDVRLSQAAMLTAVQDHLVTRRTDGLDGVQVVAVDAPDSVSARVTVSLVVYPLFGIEALMPFADGIRLTATGESRAF